MYPTKCVVWFPQRLDHSISLLLSFLIHDLGFRILSTMVGYTSFVESFVAEELHEDLWMVFSLPMFIDPQITFTMF